MNIISKVYQIERNGSFLKTTKENMLKDMQKNVEKSCELVSVTDIYIDPKIGTKMDFIGPHNDKYLIPIEKNIIHLIKENNNLIPKKYIKIYLTILMEPQNKLTVQNYNACITNVYENMKVSRYFHKPALLEEDDENVYFLRGETFSYFPVDEKNK